MLLHPGAIIAYSTASQFKLFPPVPKDQPDKKTTPYPTSEAQTFMSLLADHGLGTVTTGKNNGKRFHQLPLDEMKSPAKKLMMQHLKVDFDEYERSFLDAKTKPLPMDDIETGDASTSNTISGNTSRANTSSINLSMGDTE